MRSTRLAPSLRDSTDVECAPWSNLPDDDRALQEDCPWVIGEFVWTGFDYLGEPTPYDDYWPSRSSYFGIFDLAGLPKDRAWLYRSYWRTDAPEAELFVNGVSHGVRRKDKASRLDRFRLRWNETRYEPGELRVVARYADGTAEEATARTAGEPAALKLEVEPFDERDDLRFVDVSVVDASGTLCPDAAIPLAFEAAGGWRFKAVCNGDATSLESFAAPHMTTFHGQLVVVLEATRSGAAEAAPPLLTVRGGGMEAKLELETKR